MSRTDQANYFSKKICKHFKVIHQEMIYYFNNKTKLYESIDKRQFENYVFNFYNNSAKKIKKTLKKVDEVDEVVVKKIKEMISQFDNNTYITDVIKRSFTNLYDANLITKLNSEPNMFPIREGRKINLRTLEVTERTKEDFFDYESDVDYLEKSDLKHAEKFFSQVMKNKEARKFLQKILGYSITGENMARCFFIWFGHGANGKSVIMTLLDLILGCQYTQCDKSIFMKSKSSTGASPEKMELMNRRVGAYSEGETAENIEMNTSIIKQITGKDKITGRHLYGNMVKFNSYIKLHMLTNYKPPLDAEEAMKDRLVYIFMDSRFCKEPKLKNEYKIDNDFVNKLQTKYLSEVFTWICQGAKMFYDEGCSIDMPEDFKKRTEAIFKEQDSIETFITRAIKITGNKKDFIRKKELFTEYNSFCNENSQRCKPLHTKN